MQHQYIGYFHLLIVVAIHIGTVQTIYLLTDQIGFVLGVISKLTGFIVGVFYRDALGGLTTHGSGVFGKCKGEGIALLMGLPVAGQGTGQQLFDAGLVGEQAVLKTGGLFALGIPIEHGAAVGPVDAVDIEYAVLLDGGVGIVTAARVNIDGIQTGGQLHIVGAGGTHRAQRAHAVQRLEHGHHAGDAALGGDFVNDIGLRNAALRQGFFQVVEHNGHRAAGGNVLIRTLAGEGVGVQGFGVHHRGDDRDGGLRTQGAVSGRGGGDGGRGAAGGQQSHGGQNAG